MTTPESPLISVIMNCYNGEVYLCEAIDSVLAQTYENWEIILWDNQSTDRSAEIVSSYSDHRIRYYYAPNHTTLYEARGYAVEKSSGSLVAFLDVDDIWSPDKLMLQVPLFSDPQIGFAASRFYVKHQNKCFSYVGMDNNGSKHGGFVLDDLLRHYYVGLCTLVVRRCAYNQLEYGFNPRYNHIGDFDLVVRLSASWKMAWLDLPLSTYRSHDKSLTKVSYLSQVEELRCWIKQFAQHDQIAASPAFSTFQQRMFINKLLAYKMRRIQTNRRNINLTTYPFTVRLKALIVILLPYFILRFLYACKWLVSCFYNLLPINI